jgi:uncharacterized protein YmfQ (DUF2313 family)
MNAEQIAQWVIDNRYPKSEKEKLSDFELYHGLIDRIKDYQHHADQLAEALREALPCLEYLFADKAALVKTALTNYENNKTK